MLQKIRTHLGSMLFVIMMVSLPIVWAAGVTGVSGSQLGNSAIVDIRGGDFLSTVRSVAISILDALRIALNGVALIALLYIGFLWVTSMGDEERQGDGKNRIILVIMGLFLINVPRVIYTIFTGSNYLDSGFRKTQSVQTNGVPSTFNESDLYKCNYFFCPQNFWGNNGTMAIIKFLEVFMIVIAVVMFTWGWFMLMFRGDNEETAKQAKMRFVYGMVALVVVGFIDGIYRAIFFWGGLNTGKVISTVVSIVNFALFLAGPIAIIYIIIGAYYFITSAGNEERADKGKKILLYTFFATILLLLSYTFLIEIVGLSL